MRRTHRKPPIRVGVFDGQPAADRAVKELVEAGFPAGRISVICPTCGDDAFPAGVERTEPAGARTPAAVLTGGAIGALLGGVTASVAFAAAGGVGLLTVGPLLAPAGAVTGGFIGAMTTRGVEPEIADFYDQSLARGRILVAGDTQPEGEGLPGAAKAEEVFERCGARPVPLRRG
jgi:hypothetical protein